MRLLVCTVVCFAVASRVSAQQPGFGAEAPGRGPRLDKTQTHFVRIGMVVTAQGRNCQGIVAQASIPTDWPEQTVHEAKREVDPGAQGLDYRSIGSVKQMTVSMPFIAAGDSCRAVITYEVKRSALLPPAETSIFVKPNLKKLKNDVRVFLGPSPHIESNAPKLKQIARDTIKEASSAWQQVELLYDWTRQHVEFKSGPLKPVLQTLKDGTGDSEELSSLFVALCRGADIPARLVFVACPGHCYAEFYLEDETGQGYWFPCRPAGNREFGGIEEYRPIIQKGDNFHVPERSRERLRFVNEHLTGAGGTPTVNFIRELANP